MLAELKCSERRCGHLLGVIQPDGTEATEKPYCTAFLDGIPDEIAYGNNKHLKPYPGQRNEIVYKENKDA